MKKLPITLIALPVCAVASILGDLPDSTHAWAVHDPNRPRPPIVTMDEKDVPSDAIILLDGSEQLEGRRKGLWLGTLESPRRRNNFLWR